MSDTLIDTLQKKEYVDLKGNLEKVINKKIMDRIASKKAEVIAKVNGVEYVPPVEDEPEIVEPEDTDNTPPVDTTVIDQDNKDGQSTVTDDTGAGE